MRSPFRRRRPLAPAPGTASRVESPSYSWVAACALVIAICALVLTLLTPRTVAAPGPRAATPTTTTTATTRATLTTTPPASAMPIAVRPSERLAASRALHHPSPAQAARDLPGTTVGTGAAGAHRYGPRLGATGSIGLHVAGNKLEDQNNAVVTLRGVDHAGSEYACAQGWGIFDGPTDIASVQAMASWHADVVRVPLNEDCWLGINGYPKYGTASGYQQAIQGYVANLESQGFYVILDLHWNNGGTNQSSGQGYMVDADHGVAFWQSVAGLFGNDNKVIFDLYNEPTNFNSTTGNTWDCWLNGGSVCTNATYAIAGMQTVVTAIRNTGATNVLELNGLAYGNDVTQWATHVPTDPLHNLLAGVHLYTDNQAGQNYPQSGFHDSSGLNQDVNSNSLLANYPVIISELGESNCNRNLLDALYPTIEADGISWVNWSWNNASSCGGGPSIITNPNGSPTQLYGQGVHDNMVRYGQAPTQSTPVVPPTAAPTNTAAPQPSVSYTSASASPSTAAPGSQVTFTINVTVSGMPLVNAPLRIKFKDSTGTQQGGDFGPNLSLPVGAQSVQVVGTLPGTAPVGNYTVEIGLFGNNANYNATLFYSIGQAGFTVAGSSVATATNTPSGPTNTPVPGPTATPTNTPIPGPPNLLTNPGFENGLTGWTTSGSGTAASTSTTAHGGTTSALLNSGGGLYQVVTGLQPATQYTYSGYIRQSSVTDATYLTANSYTTSAPEVDSANGGNGAYAFVSLTFTTGASSTAASLGVYKNGGQAGTALVDDLALTVGNSAATSTPIVVATATNTPGVPTATSVPGVLPQGAFDLSTSYNHGAVTNDGGSNPNFDDYCCSYSAQALAAAGATPGGTVVFNGIHFAWPVPVNANGVDATQGRAIPAPASAAGSTLAFLAAGRDPQLNQTGTISYTDGTAQTYAISVSDWASASPVQGDQIALGTAYRNNGAGRDAIPANVYYTSVPLDARKTVQAVVMPNDGNLRVFAMSVGLANGGATSGAGTVYDGAPQNGWQDYSYGITHTLTSSSPVYGGSTQAIQGTFVTGGYGSIKFHQPTPYFDPSPYGTLHFALYMDGTTGDQFTVNANDSTGAALGPGTYITPTLNAWTVFDIPVSSLDITPTVMQDFSIHEYSGKGATVSVDDVRFVAGVVSTATPTATAPTLPTATPATGATATATAPPVGTAGPSATPAPGSVAVTINTGSTLAVIPATGYGMNDAVWDSHATDTAATTAMSQLDMGIMRMPGGSTADDYHWQANTVDNGPNYPGHQVSTTTHAAGTPYYTLAQSAISAGMQPLMTFNYGTNPTLTGPNTTADNVAWVQDANVTRHLGIKYWEQGNENFGGGYYDYSYFESNLNNNRTPQQYASDLNANAVAMKNVDPTILVGASLEIPGYYPWGAGTNQYLTGGNGAANAGVGPTGLDWNATVMQNACANLGFIDAHWYPINQTTGTDAQLLGSVHGFDAASQNKGGSNPSSFQGPAGMMAELRNELQTYCPSRASQIKIFIGESNSNADTPQRVSIVDGLFAADQFPTWLENGAANVSWWDLHNGSNTNHAAPAGVTVSAGNYSDLGTLSAGSAGEPAANTPFPSWYGMRLDALMAAPGDSLVQASSASAALVVHAATRADGSLGVLLINEDPSTAHTAALNVAGFTPAGTATTYSYGAAQASTANYAAGIQNGTAMAQQGMNVALAPYTMETLVLQPSVGASTPTPTPVPAPTATPTNSPTATPIPVATATPSGGSSVQITASSVTVQVVAPGATQTLHLTATSPSGVTGGYAQFLIYNPSHALVATVASASAVTVSAGGSQTYTATWAVPSNATPGAYTVTPQVLSGAGGALISN